MPDGELALYGPTLALAERLDRRFTEVAARVGAVEVRFPPYLPAAVLDRMDWFRAFPHLATFAVSLDAADDNLARFADGVPVGADGAVRLTDLAPVREVLMPAACYPLYAHYSGHCFDGPRCFGVRSTCFRREADYRPLERQWAFTMREVVAMGTAEEAAGLLEAGRHDIELVAAELDLPVAWAPATDPFFRPTVSPQALMQQVDPTKHELTFGGDLALASANLHHDHFGRAFSISRAGADGPVPVRTACVAVGIERWLAAVLRRHGPDPVSWP